MATPRVLDDHLHLVTTILCSCVVIVIIVVLGLTLESKLNALRTIISNGNHSQIWLRDEYDKLSKDNTTLKIERDMVTAENTELKESNRVLFGMLQEKAPPPAK